MQFQYNKIHLLLLASFASISLSSYAETYTDSEVESISLTNQENVTYTADPLTINSNSNISGSRGITFNGATTVNANVNIFNSSVEFKKDFTMDAFQLNVNMFDPGTHTINFGRDLVNKTGRIFFANRNHATLNTQIMGDVKTKTSINIRNGSSLDDTETEGNASITIGGTIDTTDLNITNTAALGGGISLGIGGESLLSGNTKILNESSSTGNTDVTFIGKMVANQFNIENKGTGTVNSQLKNTLNATALNVLNNEQSGNILLEVAGETTLTDTANITSDSKNTGNTNATFTGKVTAKQTYIENKSAGDITTKFNGGLSNQLYTKIKSSGAGNVNTTISDLNNNSLEIYNESSSGNINTTVTNTTTISHNGSRLSNSGKIVISSQPSSSGNTSSQFKGDVLTEKGIVISNFGSGNLDAEFSKTKINQGDFSFQTRSKGNTSVVFQDTLNIQQGGIDIDSSLAGTTSITFKENTNVNGNVLIETSAKAIYNSALPVGVRDSKVTFEKRLTLGDNQYVYISNDPNSNEPLTPESKLQSSVKFLDGIIAGDTGTTIAINNKKSGGDSNLIAQFGGLTKTANLFINSNNSNDRVTTLGNISTKVDFNDLQVGSAIYLADSTVSANNITLQPNPITNNNQFTLNNTKLETKNLNTNLLTALLGKSHLIVGDKASTSSNSKAALLYIQRSAQDSKVEVYGTAKFTGTKIGNNELSIYSAGTNQSAPEGKFTLTTIGDTNTAGVEFDKISYIIQNSDLSLSGKTKFDRLILRHQLDENYSPIDPNGTITLNSNTTGEGAITVIDDTLDVNNHLAGIDKKPDSSLDPEKTVLSFNGNTDVAEALIAYAKVTFKGNNHFGRYVFRDYNAASGENPEEYSDTRVIAAYTNAELNLLGNNSSEGSTEIQAFNGGRITLSGTNNLQGTLWAYGENSIINMSGQNSLITQNPDANDANLYSKGGATLTVTGINGSHNKIFGAIISDGFESVNKQMIIDGTKTTINGATYLAASKTVAFNKGKIDLNFGQNSVWLGRADSYPDISNQQLHHTALNTKFSPIGVLYLDNTNVPNSAHGSRLNESGIINVNLAEGSAWIPGEQSWISDLKGTGTVYLRYNETAAKPALDALNVENTVFVERLKNTQNNANSLHIGQLSGQNTFVMHLDTEGQNSDMLYIGKGIKQDSNSSSETTEPTTSTEAIASSTEDAPRRRARRALPDDIPTPPAVTTSVETTPSQQIVFVENYDEVANKMNVGDKVRFATINTGTSATGIKNGGDGSKQEGDFRLSSQHEPFIPDTGLYRLGIFLEYHKVKEDALETEEYNNAYNGTEMTLHKPGTEYVKAFYNTEEDSTNVYLVKDRIPVEEEPLPADEPKIEVDVKPTPEPVPPQNSQTLLPKVIRNTAEMAYQNAGLLTMDTHTKRLGSSNLYYHHNAYAAPEEQDGDGVWVRGWNNSLRKNNLFNFNTNFYQVGYSKSYLNDNRQLTLGASLDILFSKGEHLFSAKEQKASASSNAHRKGISLYGTWYNYDDEANKRRYTDLVVRLAKMKTRFNLLQPDLLTQIEGAYRNNVFSLSLEHGYDRVWKNRWFARPQAQLQYTYLSASDYKTSYGTDVYNSTVHSLVGRAGIELGTKIQENHRLFVLGNLYREFLGNQRINATDETGTLVEKVNYRRNWQTAGLGYSYRSKKFNAYINSEHIFNNGYKGSVQINGGVSFSF